MADLWTEALAEAYASAPADEYVISTLEILHAAFVDEEDNPDSIRIALDERPWDLELEAGAPLKAGQVVTFEPLALRVTQPEQDEGTFGTMRIAFDNVPQEYIAQLELAASVRSSATIVYREWIATRGGSPVEYNVSGPPDLVIGQLTVKTIEATLLTIEADAMFIDLLNKSFPRRSFTREEWPAIFGGDVG